MPAFLVPFVFVLDPQGIGLLMKIPAGGNWFDIVSITLETAAGIALLAFAFQGRFLRVNTRLDTALFLLAGTAFVLPRLINAITKPVMGFDVDKLLPMLDQIGVHMGANVVLGFCVAVIAIVMQRQATGARHSVG